MKIKNIVIGYFIFNIVYKVFKKNFKKRDYEDNDEDSDKDNNKNNNKNNSEDEDSNQDSNQDNNEEDYNEENKYQMIIYKHKKVSNYDLNKVYDNFFNKKNSKKESKESIINKDIILLDEKNDNIILYETNNFILNSFQIKDSTLYKIKYSLKSSNVKSLKLIISNDTKRFIYETNNLINDIILYEFILDNNYFDKDDNINIYLIFEPINHNINMIINDFNLIVYKKSLSKKSLNPIIIFHINNKYEPIFSDTKNILDFKEYNNDSTVFFI